MSTQDSPGATIVEPSISVTPPIFSVFPQISYLKRIIHLTIRQRHNLAPPNPTTLI